MSQHAPYDVARRESSTSLSRWHSQLHLGPVWLRTNRISTSSYRLSLASVLRYFGREPWFEVLWIPSAREAWSCEYWCCKRGMGHALFPHYWMCRDPRLSHLLEGVTCGARIFPCILSHLGRKLRACSGDLRQRCCRRRESQKITEFGCCRWKVWPTLSWYWSVTQSCVPD